MFDDITTFFAIVVTFCKARVVELVRQPPSWFKIEWRTRATGLKYYGYILQIGFTNVPNNYVTIEKIFVRVVRDIPLHAKYVCENEYFIRDATAKGSSGPQGSSEIRLQSCSQTFVSYKCDDDWETD